MTAATNATLRSLAAVVLLMLLVTTPGRAQEEPANTPSHPSWTVGLGAGFGWGTMTVENRIGKGSGAVIVGQVGLAQAGVRTWSAELEAQPFRVPNPALDEGYRTVRGLVRRSFGRPFFVAPALGVEYRSWSGVDELEGGEAALLLAISAGRHVPLAGDLVLLPEVAWGWTPLGRIDAGSGASVSVRVSVLRDLRR